MFWLRSAGYDVVHLRDEGLQRLPDDQILVKARTEGWILLTVDLDFAQLLATSGDNLRVVMRKAPVIHAGDISEWLNLFNRQDCIKFFNSSNILYQLW